MNNIENIKWALLSSIVSCLYFFLIKEYIRSKKRHIISFVIALQLLIIYLYYQSLQKINLANTANCSIWTRAFLNCHSLEDLSSANLAMPGSGFSFTNTFQNCFSIKKIPSYLRIGQTFDFQNNQLSKNAIDNFVSGLTLPLSSLTTLTITGNPGLITNATKTANVATLSNTIVMADTTRMEVGSTVDQAIAANELTNFRSGSSYAQSPLIFNINPSTDTVTIKYTSNALIAPNTAIVFGPAPTITTGSLTNARASVVGMVAGLPPVSTPSGRLRINDIKYAIANNNPIESKLNVIIVISNPCLYARRYILCREFMKRIEEEEDYVNLYIVELIYPGQRFIITNKNNKKHLQIKPLVT